MTRHGEAQAQACEICHAIGTGPLYPLAIPSNSPNAFVIDIGGDFKASAYDSIGCLVLLVRF